MQKCDGQGPTERFPVNKTFATESGYIESLLWLLYNELKRSTNPDIYKFEDDGRMLLYAGRDFRRVLTGMA